MRTTLTRWTLAAVMLAGVTAGARAQSTHLGARVGYNFDANDFLFSTNLSVPITNRVEFYPSLDIYTPERGTMLGFNGDVKVRFPVTPGPHFYFGGGLGVLNRTINDFSDNTVGANLLMGLESRSGWVHPFFEGRVLLYDQSTFQAIGGLNFTIGGR
jgi:hypothetical protein